MCCVSMETYQRTARPILRSLNSCWIVAKRKMPGDLASISASKPARFYTHLVEKLRLLSQGALRRPLDIFDLLLHSAPLLLLVVRLSRDLQRLKQQKP